MKKNKMIGAIGFIVIVAALLIAYFSANGNPIAKQKAKDVVKNYLEMTYSNAKDMEIVKAGHNWYMDTYSFEVEFKDGYGNTETFIVDTVGDRPYEINYDTRFSKLEDTKKSELFTEQATKELRKQLEAENVPLVTKDYAADELLIINVDKKNTDKTWSPNVKAFGPVGGNIILDNHLSKEQFLAEAKKIQVVLNNMGVTYDKINVSTDNYDYYVTPKKIEDIAY